MLDGSGVAARQHKSEDSLRRTWPLVEKATIIDSTVLDGARVYILESDDCVTPFITGLVSLPCFSVILPFTCFLALCHTEVRAVKWHLEWAYLRIQHLIKTDKSRIGVKEAYIKEALSKHDLAPPRQSATSTPLYIFLVLTVFVVLCHSV